MKTIEERATEYACDGRMPDGCECDICYNIYGKCERDAYIAGAKSMREELTRWHDPKKVLPEDDRYILLKIRNVRPYRVGYYDAKYLPSFRWRETDRIITSCNVIGWREIHE